MAILSEFVEIYRRTRGLTLIFYIEKKTGKWWAKDTNSKEKWFGDNEFQLFDKIISDIKMRANQAELIYMVNKNRGK